MKVRKALITAAHPDHSALPQQRLVDRDGVGKSALGILLGEVASAGIDEVALVVRPQDAEALAAAVPEGMPTPTFLPQTEVRGYAHALSMGRDFIADEAFLHLIGDHLFISDVDRSCAQQMVAAAEAEGCSVSAVQATRERDLKWYGVVGGRRQVGRQDLYRVERVLEKPTPTEAEQELLVPGLRAGHYLCFLGMHVLSPAIFEEIHIGPQKDPISAALHRLAQRERYLALEVQGRRQNIGVKYGLLHAQLALALDGVDRDRILVDLLDTLARRSLSSGD